MRVSVYKEPGVNYLTRTEGLRSPSAGRSGVVLADLPGCMLKEQTGRHLGGEGAVVLR
jgi:hypothetical protein